MKRTKVTSSLIASLGYKPNTQTLEVEFTDTGHVYQYFDVPNREFLRLINAKSLGRYFSFNIKDEYRYIKIRP